MTLNKVHPYRAHTYTTQRQSSTCQPSVVESDSDKSSHAARMAQTLGSQRPWADSFVPQTPTTILTPSVSTDDNDEENRRLLEEHQRGEDPPPSYENSRLPPAQELPTGLERPSQSILPVRSPPGVASEEAESRAEEQPLLHSRDPEIAYDSTTTEDRRGVRSWWRRSNKERDQGRKRFQVAIIFMASLFICLWLMAQQGYSPVETIADPHDLPPISREYTRHEQSQPISGTFTFYDLLDLSTESGSIDITIDPRAGEKPARLRLSSKSGSIRVKLEDAYLKDILSSKSTLRPWDTVIKAQSGTITSELPLGGGSTTLLEAVSGTITSTFFANHVGPYENVSTLTTLTNSATQQITIEATPDMSPITNLVARHHVRGSGGMNINYPQLWEGVMHAVVRGSGTVNVQGQGLQYQKQGDRDIYAQRGKGQAVEVRCDGSGSINVDCSA